MVEITFIHNGIRYRGNYETERRTDGRESYVVFTCDIGRQHVEAASQDNLAKKLMNMLDNSPVEPTSLCRGFEKKR